MLLPLTDISYYRRLLLYGYLELWLRGYSGWGVKLTPHPHLVPRLRMFGSMARLPQYVFIAWCSVYCHSNDSRSRPSDLFVTFLYNRHFSRSPWMGDRQIASPLPTQNSTTHKKCGHTSMPRPGIEPTVPAFDRCKTIRALDRAATGAGTMEVMDHKYVSYHVPISL
jgi:hypothetical protein